MMRTALGRTGPFVLATVLTLALARPAAAIPAFSRKYATSCATCHVAFPKLNAFGAAFRNNGYRMPGGDEAYLKDENIKLGADAWKRLWPDAIWPGDISYLPPLSMLIENELEYRPEAAVETDFRTPSDVSLLAGGTFGDSLSFFGRVNLVAPGADVHVHRFFGQFNRMFGSSLLNLRIGQIEPRAVPFSSNQRLAREDYLINTATLPLDAWVDYLTDMAASDEHDDDDHGMALTSAAGALLDEDHDAAGDEHDEAVDPRLALIGMGGHQHGETFTLSTTQDGLELWGATTGFGGKGGFEYALGVVNGNGAGDFENLGTNDNNSSKDLYWRASYKIGGMSVMGDADTAPQSANNWQDDSVRVGVFGYHGTAPFTFTRTMLDDEHDEMPGARAFGALLNEVAMTESFAVEEDFRRIGADVSLSYGSLNLFGAYVWGRTEMSPELLAGSEIDFRAVLTQADYVVYPWLVASLRFERADYDDAFGDVERWVPHVTALLRANVKATAEAVFYDDDLVDNSYRFWFNFGF